MRITWLGHACFLLEEDGYRIAVDPYAGVEGYPPLRVEAHAVFCSHEHGDHSFRRGVPLLPRRESPFSVREVPAFHDGQGGALRGGNTIRVFATRTGSVCHLGDLGHPLSDAQAAEIGPVEVVLLPVGGVYTIGPREALEVIRRLRPRCAVPMHYRHGPFGLPQVGGVELFLRLVPPEEVTDLPGPSFFLGDAPAGILMPAWPAGPSGD